MKGSSYAFDMGGVTITLFRTLGPQGHAGDVRIGNAIGFGIKTELMGHWCNGRVSAPLQEWNRYLTSICTELWALAAAYKCQADAFNLAGKIVSFKMMCNRHSEIVEIHKALAGSIVPLAGIIEVV